MIRITFNKERVQFSSGLEVNLSIWNQKTERVLGKKANSESNK